MRRVAVVDIGSNSVRLVIFEGPRRAPFQISNEKALCGLGRDIGPNGELNKTTMDAAISTLRRFRAVLDEHGRPETFAIATAAVRDAPNASDFVARVRNLGFDVDVISGEREAELSAYGVVSQTPAAHGVVGDMGGGSLELTRVDNGDLREAVSLSIGPLRLMQLVGDRPQDANSIIDDAIGEAPWLAKSSGETLYAVGGAWRAIARIRMRMRNYALPVLHQFEMSRQEAIEICALIAGQSKESLTEIPGIPRKRIDTLPFAALVLQRVLEVSNVKRLAISASGLREGLLYASLPEETQAHDPLSAALEFFGNRLSPDPDYGLAAASFIGPVLTDRGEDTNRRICDAACTLIDVAAYFHPDMRGAMAHDIAVRTALSGITHRERIMIAMALFARHEGRRASSPKPELAAMIDEQDLLYARKLGVAMRFAGSLAPKSPGLLEECSLALDEETLVLRGPSGLADRMDEQQRRRFTSLAEICGVAGIVDAN
ncbi:MAG: Ppx/GppA family phosphatase [Pseudomonadota bacterium]